MLILGSDQVISLTGACGYNVNGEKYLAVPCSFGQKRGALFLIRFQLADLFLRFLFMTRLIGTSGREIEISVQRPGASSGEGAGVGVSGSRTPSSRFPLVPAGHGSWICPAQPDFCLFQGTGAVGSPVAPKPYPGLQFSLQGWAWARGWAQPPCCCSRWVLGSCPSLPAQPF